MATSRTNKKLSPPSPTFYLTVGQSISCMLVKKTVLFVGTTCGSIILFNIQDCRKIASIKAFDKGGLLWLDLICTSDINIQTQTGENNDKVYIKGFKTLTTPKKLASAFNPIQCFPVVHYAFFVPVSFWFTL